MSGRRPMLTGARGWALLVGGVVVVDVVVDEDEMLSRAFDRFRSTHPLVAWFLVLATAAHLLRAVPRFLDIFQLLFLVRRVHRR